MFCVFYPNIMKLEVCKCSIRNMYKGIKSKVQIDPDVSDYFMCKVGVRQGENLSPFLFSIYIND